KRRAARLRAMDALEQKHRLEQGEIRPRVPPIGREPRHVWMACPQLLQTLRYGYVIESGLARGKRFGRNDTLRAFGMCLKGAEEKRHRPMLLHQARQFVERCE